MPGLAPGLTVDAFLRVGARVVGMDRREAGRKEDRYRHVVVELTDEADVQRAVTEGLCDRPLSHLVGIAGGALPDEPTSRGDPASIDVGLFRTSVEATLTGQFIVLRACLGRLAGSPSEDRSVTFTSSFNSLSAQGLPAYSAAKAGLLGLIWAGLPLGSRGSG